MNPNHSVVQCLITCSAKCQGERLFVCVGGCVVDGFLDSTYAEVLSVKVCSL